MPEEKVTRTFDLLTGNEFQSVQDIFKDKENYEAILQKKLQSSITRYSNGFEIDRYEISAYGIRAFNKLEKDDYGIYIDYRDLKNDLVFVPLRETILPSSEKEITKDMVKDLNDVLLERAYNEPFARHGHDFKSKELKYYFSIWNWYKPIEGKVVTMEELTDIEKANVNLIKQVMQKRNNG